jgi:TetR/AcrR family transcriptional regulator
MKRLPTAIRQEQIKKAVLEIIFEEGLSRLSTRNVANRVGISEGALFRHFPSKVAILRGIMADVEGDLITRLRKVAESNEAPEDRLLRFLCTHVTYLIEKRGITLLLLSEAAHHGDDELKSSLRRVLTAMNGMVEGIVSDGIHDGSWSDSVDPRDAAVLYMGIPVSLNVNRILNPGAIETENFCRRMLDILLGGLAGGGEGRAAAQSSEASS